MTRHLTSGRTAAVALGAIAVGAVLALLTVIGGTAPAGAGSPATAATVEPVASKG